jgi:hypothetical protein
MVYDRIFFLLNELLQGNIENLKTPMVFKGLADFPEVKISQIGFNLFEMRQVGEDQVLVLELLICPGSKQVIPLCYQDNLGLKWTFEGDSFNLKSHQEICIFLLGWLQVLQAYHFQKKVPKDPAKNHKGTNK